MIPLKLPVRRHWPPHRPPRQLPKARRMSIAIGMLVGDGLVMASDTQEIGGPFKSDVHKTDLLDVWPKGRDRANTYAIAGAGHSGFVEKITRKLRAALNDKSLDREGVTEAIERGLAGFYHKHIYPNPDQNRVAVQFLIGLSHSGSLDLLVTEETSVGPAGKYGAVGVGAMVPRSFLDGLYEPEAPLDSSIINAAYIIWKVKQSVDGCGHFTDITVLRPEVSFSISRVSVQHWEIVFAKCDLVSAAVLKSAFDYRGHLPRPIPDVLPAVQNIRRQIQEDTARLSMTIAQLTGLRWKIEAPPGKSL